MTEPAYRLSLERIGQAARIIDPVFLHTPQFVCEPLSDELGTRLALKIETLNPIRSFKGRGADLLVSQAADDARLVCASAGNFGQAMAWACRKKGLPLTVFAGTHANHLKVERMRKLGAHVILHGEDFDAAKLEARRVASEQGARFVEDSLDIETLEGAGTMGLELLAFPEPLDALLIALGNGAMLNGVARVMKARSPRTRIIAVQAAGAPAMIESWRAGRLIAHDQTHTIADGIAVRVPVPQALEDMRGLVDDAILVREETIIEGIRLLCRHAGVVTEPSGAVGIAAILERPEMFRDQMVGTIVCGGNLTGEQMRQWLMQK
ncbi:MAG TPA: threonine/serine dehydratase [Blastocatellia bacterium]|nr:threonine/serine dehydratase [Blastocatellia bacterium]